MLVLILFLGWQWNYHPPVIDPDICWVSDSIDERLDCGPNTNCDNRWSWDSMTDVGCDARRIHVA